MEGWTPEHDDQHKIAQLPKAAMCYVSYAKNLILGNGPHVGPMIEGLWPWDWKWWKPSDDPIRDLVKAGALIAAEIDRLQRMNRVSDVEPVPVGNVHKVQHARDVAAGRRDHNLST